jgi:putative MATE family efflux protein
VLNTTLMRELARLAWPAVLQGLVVTVVFFTDRMMLGWYSPETLGSMQISGPVLWSCFSVFGAYAAGVMAVVGRSIGAGDQERAHRTVSTVLVFGLCVGLVVSGLGLAGRPLFADLLASGPETSQAIRDLAQSYMGIVFLAAPLLFMGIGGVTALQADGDTRTPMFVSAAQGLLNLGLTWVLTFGHLGAPELGVVGAALGSAASFVLGTSIILVVLVRRKGPVSLLPLTPPSMAALRPVLKVAGPAFGERAIFHTAFLVFVAYVGMLGDLAVITNQALVAIESVGFMVTHGIGIAAGALVAQKLGAGALDDAARVGWLSALLGIAVLGGVAVTFLIIPETLLGVFLGDDNPEAIALGVPCLRMAAICLPLMAVTDAMAGSLRGAGDTRTPMLVAIAGPVTMRLLMCWFLALHLGWGLYGIWVGTTLDWAIRAVFLSWVYHRGKWKSIEV